jgi:hypothetical protein
MRSLIGRGGLDRSSPSCVVDTYPIQIRDQVCETMSYLLLKIARGTELPSIRLLTYGRVESGRLLHPRLP